MGPEGGSEGGEVIAQGYTQEDIQYKKILYRKLLKENDLSSRVFF